MQKTMTALLISEAGPLSLVDSPASMPEFALLSQSLSVQEMGQGSSAGRGQTGCDTVCLHHINLM